MTRPLAFAVGRPANFPRKGPSRAAVERTDLFPAGYMQFLRVCVYAQEPSREACGQKERGLQNRDRERSGNRRVGPRDTSSWEIWVPRASARRPQGLGRVTYRIVSTSRCMVYKTVIDFSCGFDCHAYVVYVRPYRMYSLVQCFALCNCLRHG